MGMLFCFSANSEVLERLFGPRSHPRKGVRGNGLECTRENSGRTTSLWVKALGQHVCLYVILLIFFFPIPLLSLIYVVFDLKTLPKIRDVTGKLFDGR